MKGLVFSFKKSGIKSQRITNFTPSDIRYFIKRYGMMCVMILLLFCGLAFGSVFAQNADSNLLNSLDFLFTTNLEARLSQDFIGTFCACFASNFIFIISLFLLGFTPWGALVIPFVLLFKGYGIGLTAGYLFVKQSLAGVGFYLLILLPGTFLFSLALIKFSVKSFLLSKQMFLSIVGKSGTKQFSNLMTKSFCSELMSALIMSFCASILDTALWTLFSGAFNF